MIDVNNNKLNSDLGIAERSIGNHRFKIELLPCGPAGEVFLELLDILGPTIGVAIDKFRNLDYVTPEDDTSLAEVFSTLTSKMVRAEFNSVVDILLKDCTIDGAPFDKNTHLRGEFQTYVGLVSFALEENFLDFFIGYLKELGLEIPSLRNFMDLMKKKESSGTIQTPQTTEDQLND